MVNTLFWWRDQGASTAQPVRAAVFALLRFVTRLTLAVRSIISTTNPQNILSIVFICLFSSNFVHHSIHNDNFVPSARLHLHKNDYNSRKTLIFSTIPRKLIIKTRCALPRQEKKL